MDRETALLVALVMLSLAALVVGMSGWILLARDRRLSGDRASASDTVREGHHEVPEEA